jgi:broad specificity phosphatase PhoE
VALTVIGVRHGEVHNPNGVIYSGLAGYGLSDEGRRQARSVAEALRDVPIAALYASPLDRAMETARLIAEATGADVIPEIRLSEWRFWEQWAGLTWEELRTGGLEAWEAYQRDPAAVTSGESLAELADRVQAWLADVRDAEPDGLVVAVSHLEPLRAVLLRLLERPAADLFQLVIGPAEGVRLAPDPDPTPLRAEAFRALRL